MLSRDWHCLNRTCGKQFHSYARGNPECPHCGCVRVSWVPGGGHIGKSSPGIDRTLNVLAADYGLTNLNSPSPSRTNNAMPRRSTPRNANLLGVKQWAPGFSSPVYDTASCDVSTSAVNVRGVQIPGRRFERSPNMVSPGLGDNLMTQVQGVHRPGRPR